MEFERDDADPVYFETRNEDVTRGIEPLLHLNYRIVDEGTAVGDELSDFTRTVEVNINWISRIGVEEFVDLRREYIRQGAGMGDNEDEYVENSLLEEHVNAFVTGASGSNTVDYEALVERDFDALRQAVEDHDEAMDWGQLYAAELDSRNRAAVKDWVDERRVDDRLRRFDTLRFSQLQAMDAYPERVGNLGFGFIGPPEIVFWDGIDTLIGYTPEAEERNTGDRDEQRAYQDEMDEEYSNLSCNLSSQQRLERNDDGDLVVRHERPLAERLSSERFGWYFERTVPDDYLERAAEIHGYDSKDTVVQAVYDLVVETVEEAAAEYDFMGGSDDRIAGLSERVDGTTP